jgi:hypothetical protein
MRPWIDVRCGSCDRGIQHVLVRGCDLDDQHLRLLAPEDRVAAMGDIARSGDVEWARSACLGVARELLATAARSLRRSPVSRQEVAVALGTLADAADWRRLARACRSGGAS